MSGSKGARASPDLIAACHVFHRLSMPRHPSEALMRLIVLSKTHAWGRFVLQPYEIAKAAPTHALCFDVFSGRPYKPQGRPGKPFNSQCHSPSRSKPERKLVSTIACRSEGLPSRSPCNGRRLVEPDGIEPTTSCLQSTRSTN